MADADVVVIGAGSGGLATAAYLARAGRRVRVIDARAHLGGHMSAFTGDGYEFDTGLHYTVADYPKALLNPLGIDVIFHEHDPDAMFTLVFPDMTFFRSRRVSTLSGSGCMPRSRRSTGPSTPS